MERKSDGVRSRRDRVRAREPAAGMRGGACARPRSVSAGAAAACFVCARAGRARERGGRDGRQLLQTAGGQEDGGHRDDKKGVQGHGEEVPSRQVQGAVARENGGFEPRARGADRPRPPQEVRHAR